MKTFLQNFRQVKTLALLFSLLFSVSGVAFAQTPTISSFAPNSGPVGMKVTLNGSNFTNASAVSFNGTAAASFSIISDVKIEAFVAPGTQSGKIAVTNATGTTQSVSDFTVYVKWVGGNSNENWDDALNWSNGLVPTSTTNVMIEPGGSPVITNTAECNNLTLLSAQLTLNNTTSDLRISGDFSISSSTFSHTAGKITFTGSASPQRIPALTYYNVVINGTGTKELQGNTAINNLTFVNSNLTTKDLSNITLTLNGTIAGEDINHSYIGKLVKSRSVSGVVTDNFGNIGIGFTNTGGGDWGTVTATRVTGVAITGPSNTKSISRYWTITPTIPNANSTVALTLTWLSTENNGLAFTNGKAQAWRKETNDVNWTPVDNMQDIVVPIANVNERRITVNTNTFSTWAVSDQANPLPVTMTYFTGKATAAGSQLNWGTASEENSEVFVIERSVNGKDFEAIGKVKAAGNSNQERKYEFLDRNASAKTTYYRLRQVDLDGAFEYSAIVTVTGQKTLDLNVVAYPNPFSETLNLKLNTAVSKAEVVLMSIDGKEIFRQAINESAPVNNVSLNNLPKMKPGFYLLNVVANGKTTVLKVAQQ